MVQQRARRRNFILMDWLLLVCCCCCCFGVVESRRPHPFRQRPSLLSPKQTRPLDHRWKRMRGGEAREENGGDEEEEEEDNATAELVVERKTKEEETDTALIDHNTAETTTTTISPSITTTDEEEDESDDNDDEEATVASFTLDEARAAELRAQGKTLHDAQDYKQAAQLFQQASRYCQGDDAATCHLHQALCCLKSKQYEQAMDCCTIVLEQMPDIHTSVRARAFHRRAKAKLELQLPALSDARSAAFLGDSRAVTLYGKLMRQESSSSSLSNSSEEKWKSSSGSSPSLVESLLSKSSDSTVDNSDMFPTSLLSGLMGANNGNNNNDAGSLAKSVVKKLSKKLDDESTQDTICGYFQQASGPQLHGLANMAGLSVTESQAQKVANYLNGVTKKGLRRTVKLTRRTVYVVSILRKVSKIIQKYRNLIILWFVVLWTKSAVLRPLPVNKKLVRKQRQAAAAPPLNSAPPKRVTTGHVLL